ncbi:MAG: YdcF family protein [Oscillospiraceae bacterium]|nr:YdcF family protein [Oscillospiraceae bacterium]
MTFSLKKADNRRLLAALLSTFTLLNPTLLYGIFNVGTLMLAGLTLLLWGRYITAKGRGPLWLQKSFLWICRIGWGFFLVCSVLMYLFTLAKALPASAGASVIVVPGAQVIGDRPSLMLQNRLDRGLQLWKAHPNSVFVVCGGKSEGAPYSEAEVMTLYLTQNGVSPHDIYQEDQSVNTQQNFMFAAQIIKEKQLKGPVVIATDAFHQTRCRLWAGRYGLDDAYSAICFPSWGIAPVYWLREVCGIAHFYVFC